MKIITVRSGNSLSKWKEDRSPGSSNQFVSLHNKLREDKNNLFAPLHKGREGSSHDKINRFVNRNRKWKEDKNSLSVKQNAVMREPASRIMEMATVVDAIEDFSIVT